MKENVFKQNSYYEGLIQNYFGGAKGCFSAFMHFFYQYNQSLFCCKEYSTLFQELYKTELENCEILSQILLKMGGDSKYYSSSRKFLSGYNVDYVKNFAKIFLNDIEMLEINVLENKSLILKIEDSQIRDWLKKILENKKKSLKILRENYFKNNVVN